MVGVVGHDLRLRPPDLPAGALEGLYSPGRDALAPLKIQYLQPPEAAGSSPVRPVTLNTDFIS